MKAASIQDFRELARKRLPHLLFEYLDGGSYDEITLGRNVSRLREIALRQRVMMDVSKLSLKTEWFGREVSMPVGLGPVGFSGMFARRGETQAARAAEKAGVPFCLSTLSICDVEETARASAAPIWFQFYITKDRGFMQALLERAGEQKCGALVFTVDLPLPGSRYRDFRSGMSGTPGLANEMRRVWQGITRPQWLWDVQLNGGPHHFGNLVSAVGKSQGLGNFAAWVAANFDPTLTWSTIEWIRKHWRGPLIVKGVLDADDAREAVAQGVEGVIVSNHGGRQLDGALASIDALPRVAEAVDGRATVLMDGGVRSGLDVLRAMASGAQGVLLGRAWAYALAADGEAGVTLALNIIRSELITAMALTGCADVRRADRGLLDSIDSAR